jgi:hypothetical protein
MVDIAAPHADIALGPSYKEVVQSRLERQGGRGSLTRLLIVGQLGGTALEDSASAVRLHEQAFRRILSEERASPITGVLIIHQRSFVHLIEAGGDTATSFLREVQAEEGRTGAILHSVKVLAACEDCAQPYFNKWYHYCLQVHVISCTACLHLLVAIHVAGDLWYISCKQMKTDSGGDTDGADAVDAAWEVMDKLISLGHELSQESGERGDLRRRHAHLVASDERCMALTERTEFLTPSHYLALYDSPIDLVLEEELIWPAQPSVKHML